MVIVDEIKKSKRKTIAIKVDINGKVIVYAPINCTSKRIEDFVNSKQDWIIKSKQKILFTNNIYDTKNIKIGDEIYLFGDKYKLLVGNDKSVKIEGKYIILPVNYQKNLETHLKKWIVKFSKDYLSNRLDLVAGKLNFTNYTFKISYARGKWGSCSNERKIMLNFRLIECPVEIIDYIITHELVHINHFNHGSMFYKELESYYPNSKDYVKWLKQNAGILSSY